MERQEILVLDASVILKWFAEEGDSDKAKQYRSDYENDKFRVAVPDLLMYELANALLKGKKLSAKDIQIVLQSIYDMDFFVVEPAEQMMGRAAELAEKYELAIYDAAYVALAELVDAKFVTADMSLIRKVEELDFVVSLQNGHISL